MAVSASVSVLSFRQKSVSRSVLNLICFSRNTTTSPTTQKAIPTYHTNFSAWLYVQITSDCVVLLKELIKLAVA